MSITLNNRIAEIIADFRTQIRMDTEVLEEIIKEEHIAEEHIAEIIADFRTRIRINTEVLEDVVKEVVTIAYDEGHSDGYSDGYDVGHEDGYSEGMEHTF